MTCVAGHGALAKQTGIDGNLWRVLSASRIRHDMGFQPDLENAKHLLEKNDGAGITFTATAIR